MWLGSRYPVGSSKLGQISPLLAYPNPFTQYPTWNLINALTWCFCDATSITPKNVVKPLIRFSLYSNLVLRIWLSTSDVFCLISIDKFFTCPLQIQWFNYARELISPFNDDNLDK